MANFDFRGAQINSQTIIENVFGNLSIPQNVIVPKDLATEALERITNIEASIDAIKDDDAEVTMRAMAHLEETKKALKSPNTPLETVTNGLKNSAETLTHLEKNISLGTKIIESIAKLTSWLLSAAGGANLG